MLQERDRQVKAHHDPRQAIQVGRGVGERQTQDACGLRAMALHNLKHFPP
jgi:hypothetical protein